MLISIKMKKEIFEEVEIPEGVEVNLEDSFLTVKGPEGENKREFNTRGLVFEKKDNKVIVGKKVATKNDKKRIYTLQSHVRNMIKGVSEKFEYKLKIAFVHFPMTVEVNGREITIKNFLGERTPRKVSIPEGADIKVEKDVITISSTDKEIAGQAAANLERVTRIRLRDRRIFQDGIFITNKAGREL